MSTTGKSKQLIIALYLILSEYYGASNCSLIIKCVYSTAIVWKSIFVEVCAAHSGADGEELVRLQRACMVTNRDVKQLNN